MQSKFENNPHNSTVLKKTITTGHCSLIFCSKVVLCTWVYKEKNQHNPNNNPNSQHVRCCILKAMTIRFINSSVKAEFENHFQVTQTKLKCKNCNPETPQPGVKLTDPYLWRLSGIERFSKAQKRKLYILMFHYRLLKTCCPAINTGPATSKLSHAYIYCRELLKPGK